MSLQPVTIPRLADWRARLRRYLATVAHRAVEPGQHDCCLFGAGALEAQTGLDLVAQWRGQYRTFAEGYRLLRRAGFADHVDFIAQHLPESYPLAAHCGDIAVVRADEGDAVGVVQGEAIYALMPRGLALLPMNAQSRIFRVGGA